MFSVVIALLVLYLFYRNYLSPNTGPVPLLPGHLPIIGYSLKWLKAKDGDLYQTLVLDTEEFTSNNGGVSKGWIPFVKPIYVVTDIEDAKALSNQFYDKMEVYDFVKMYFGEFLVAKEAVWRANKRILDLSLKQNKLYGYLDIFNDQASRFVDDVGKKVNEEADFYQLIKSNIMTTSHRTIFGSLENAEEVISKHTEIYSNVIDVFLMRLRNIWMMSDFLYNLSGYKKSYEEAFEDLTVVTNQIVNSRKSELLERLKNKEEPKVTGSKFRSTLDIILENTTKENHCSYLDDQMKTLTLNVLFASADTTSSTLQAVFSCMGSSVKVQERIYEEIIEVVGDHDVTTEHLSKLVYLEAAIKEASRLFPAAPIVGRQTNKVTKLRNETVPKGSSIILHLRGICRNKKDWGEDANEYKPERWLDPARLPPNMSSFASFSVGKRNCIGKAYAMMFMKILAVHVIRKYRIQGDHSKLKFSFIGTVHVSGGTLLKFEKR